LLPFAAVDVCSPTTCFNKSNQLKKISALAQSPAGGLGCPLSILKIDIDFFIFDAGGKPS